MMLAALLLLQTAAPPREVEPVLQFPEPGVDNPASYEGYQTRFYRDARGNTLQIYINQRDGRVVDVWGNAANESLGFTIRNAAGQPPPITWGAAKATVDVQDKRRRVEYQLEVGAPTVTIGRFLLGSMRLERDFQYFKGHQQPFTAPGFARPELDTLLANLERLDAGERRRHLELLGAGSVLELRARLQPALSLAREGTELRVGIEQRSFDGRNRLALELGVNQSDADIALAGNAVSVRSKAGGPIRLSVRVSTDADPLTPLRYTEIFNRGFLQYYDSLRADAERIQRKAPAARTAAEQGRGLQFRRTERQVLSLGLLSSHEKLMAGLPNYGTYFGRDMLMTALMMETVWTDRMAEYVIASVLGKLAPTGEVSHEEALGGQAIREHAAVYNNTMGAFFQARSKGERVMADSSLVQARQILSGLQTVRENYLMMDDDFQFPVFVARYLTNREIPAEQKRAFLLAPTPEQNGVTRLTLLLRNLAYVARMAQPYAQNPVATNLIGFPARTETDWFPGSWRDSNVGYANGRFAMDINVVWVPAALQSLGTVLPVLRELGLPLDATSGPLGEYLRSPEALQRTIIAWNGTARHFQVSLAPAQVRERVQARLARMPTEERQYWSAVVERNAPNTNFQFLALSLDAAGQPIPVANTDVATRLFVLTPEQVRDDVRSVMLPYPIGLFIPGIGPVVANDAYASPQVWEAFLKDHYHSPRVVWGREVNLLLLGLARQIEATNDPSGTLRQALRDTRAAVEASGLKDQELWSYRIENGRLVPVRYAASTDLQLWNLTALAVQYELAKLAGDSLRRR